MIAIASLRHPDVFVVGNKPCQLGTCAWEESKIMHMCYTSAMKVIVYPLKDKHKIVFPYSPISVLVEFLLYPIHRYALISQLKMHSCCVTEG